MSQRFIPTNSIQPSRTLRLCTAASLTFVLLTCIGCYDAHALIEQIRTDALRNRLHEIDLGTFRTTMPRDPKTNLLMQMELHLFGTAPQYRIHAIQERLESESYRLRSETLAAIRKTNGDELSEPDLTHLRDRLEQVVNNVLSDAPIKSLGIEELKIVYE